MRAYVSTDPVLLTWDEGMHFHTQYLDLVSNGSYVRDLRGRKIGRIKDNRPAIGYHATHNGQVFFGNITDKILIQRIRRYMDEYFDQQYTNCSCMANYLTTGTFISCDDRPGRMVVTQHMRVYKPGERIGIGDMLGIIYVEPRMMRSRRMGVRRQFLKVQAARRKNGGFAAALTPAQNVFSPEDLIQFYLNPIGEEYHFMVCVGHHQGEPVWLSQLCYRKAGEPMVPLVITKGMREPSQTYTPGIVLLKRRR